VHPREVFKAAIAANAAAVVLAHNHPSGDPTPSEADIKVTRDLIRAGQLLKIEVLDHVIIGRATPERQKDYVRRCANWDIFRSPAAQTIPVVNWRVIIRPNAEADLQEARLGMNPGAWVWAKNCWTRFAARCACWRPTPNADRFITAIFAGCSRAVFPTNFSIASKATASLSFASCTRNGNISGN
jgi:hypothetical protein